MIRVESSIRRFQASLKSYSQHSKRTEVEIVNRAVKDVALRAMQFTETADPGRIQAELYRDNIAVKLATKRIAGRRGKVQVDRFGNTRLKKSGRAKTYSRSIRQAEIAREAAKIVKRRVASARATAAGWVRGAQRVGASSRGFRVASGSSAARGTGQKATLSNPRAFIRNALITRSQKTGKRTGAGNLPNAIRGLRKAIAFVSTDRENYVRKKQIAAVFRKP